MKNKHHFIPASYLAGFSNGSGRKGVLYVLDKELPKIYRNTAENVAYIKNYYKVTEDGEDSDIVEDALAELESNSIEILRKIDVDLELPSESLFVDFLYYVALLSARVPSVRESFNKSFLQIVRLVSSYHVNNNTPAKIQENLNDIGIPIENDIETNELIKLVKGQDSNVRIHKNYKISTMLHSAKIIHQLLMDRTWNIFYKTQNQSSEFVTSDSPVLLVFKNSNSVYDSPGFGLENTQVFFPLTNNTLLIGEYDMEIYPSLRITNSMIRRFNTLQTVLSRRYIYSRNQYYNMYNNRLKITSEKLFDLAV